MNRRFTFRVYTLLEAFLFLIFVSGLFVFIMFLAGIYLRPHLPEIEGTGEIFLKGILILIIIGAFAIGRNLITANLNVEINDIGVSFELDKSKLGLRKRNIFIHWNELNAWHLMEEHVSGETWSPPCLIVKYQGNRKYSIYYPDNKENLFLFNQFYKVFLENIDVFNQKNRNVAPIRAISYIQMYRTFHLIIALCVLAIAPLFMYYYLFIYDKPRLLTNTEWFFVIFIFVFMSFIGIKMFLEAWGKDGDE